MAQKTVCEGKWLAENPLIDHPQDAIFDVRSRRMVTTAETPPLSDPLQ